MLFKLPDELAFLRKTVQHTTDESLAGKSVVLTGGTSGVGLAALQELASHAAEIILVSRNLEKADRVIADIQSSHDVVIHSYYADFSKLDTIREVANTILKNHPTIDVLINSVGMHSTKKRYNEDGFEMVFCVNHLGPFLFTKLLYPGLQRSNSARVIQVNSEGHRFNGLRLYDLDWKKRIYTGLRGYGASKTAQLMTVWELAEMWKDNNITVNAMHPGAVKSSIGTNNGFLYRWFSKLFIQPFLKDPSISGNALYYLAAAKELEGVTGTFFNLTIEEPPAPHALNREKGKELYNKTMTLVGLESNEERD